jgi:hypothetical protein
MHNQVIQKRARALVAIAMVSALIACEGRTVKNELAKSEPPRCRLLSIPEKGVGTELKLVASRVRRDEYLIKGTNVSEKTLYLSYAPAENSKPGRLFYARFEKEDPSGNYAPVRDEADSADSILPLFPRQAFEYHFYQKERGRFRVVIGYLVDVGVVKLLNDPDCLFQKNDEDHTAIVNSWAQIRTEPIETGR